MSDITYVKKMLDADGSTTGIVTVDSTTDFHLRAVVYLNADDQDTKALIVDEIVSSTQLALRDPNANTFARFNSSDYTTAENASLTQPDQGASAIVAPTTR